MALLVLVGLCLPLFASAATTRTWASVLYTYHGEKSPGLEAGPQVLTPLGANQLKDAGAFLRSRYITGAAGNSTDTGSSASLDSSISQDSLDNSQVQIWALDEEFVTASAVALMQGLYPPKSSPSTLGDGSSLDWPLNGYQYANVETLNYLDFNYIWLAGNDQCPTYNTYISNTQSSDSFLSTLQSAAPFLSSLETTFPDLPSSVFTYQYATDLWEYVRYQYNNNETYHSKLSSNTSIMTQLYSLASSQAKTLNSPIPISDGNQNWILTLSGQTLSAYILGQFQRTIAYQYAPRHGSSAPPIMSLLFGSYSPMSAFFALSQLSSNPITTSQFSTLPLHGSVMGFELFSNQQDANDTAFPGSTDDLYVRFAWRNGTQNSSSMLSYPLFGRGNSQDDMRWDDFAEGMEDLALGDVWDWCGICQSENLFCAGIKANLDASTADPAQATSSTSKHHLSTAAAGVIGAVVTIGVASLIFALLLLLGFRLRQLQHPPSSSTAANPWHEAAAGGGLGVLKRSGTAKGGFKGAEKLESDADVMDGKRGHERIGSWEMKGGAGVGKGGSGSLDKEVREGREREGVVSMADYGRRSEDGLAGVDPFGKGVEAEERV